MKRDMDVRRCEPISSSRPRKPAGVRAVEGSEVDRDRDVPVCSRRQRDDRNDCRYYISSLTVGVKPFAHAVRSHWGIENSCHWSLDITYREDESRIRDKHLRENFAWLNRLTLSLLKQHPGPDSVAMKRRSCGWNETSCWKSLPEQQLSEALALMVAAFEFFGAVPKEVWWDNPRTVRARADPGGARTSVPASLRGDG